MDGSGGNGFVACGFDRIGECGFASRSPSIKSDRYERVGVWRRRLDACHTKTERGKNLIFVFAG